MANPIFDRYIGIDYSGAATPTSSLKGLRVYLGDRSSSPAEVEPPPSPRKYWTRRGVAEWLLERLADGPSAIVGIDHAFSFPMRYFEKHGLVPDWDVFLDDFQQHWPTDGDHVYVDFVRDGLEGDGAARTGNNRWKRLTDRRSGSAKSVFHFDVQGSVAKSTHSGIPWLRTLRRNLGDRLHFWPFDGWQIPDGKSVVTEAYPRLWNQNFPPEGRTPDQHDAYSVARWLREADLDGSLSRHFDPPLTPSERTIAEVEGWILGVLAPRAIAIPQTPKARSLAMASSDKENSRRQDRGPASTSLDDGGPHGRSLYCPHARRDDTAPADDRRLPLDDRGGNPGPWGPGGTSRRRDLRGGGGRQPACRLRRCG